jgi:hypothetical protein
MKIFQIILLFFFLVSCSNTPIEATQPQLKIKITAIVNSTTKQPVKENLTIINWLNSDGRVLYSEEYKNRINLEVLVPADRQTKMTIIVKSPGYHQWAQEIRANQNTSKIYDLIIQLIPLSPGQGETNIMQQLGD